MINLKFKNENEEDVENYKDDDNLKTTNEEDRKNEIIFGLVFNIE